MDTDVLKFLDQNSQNSFYDQTDPTTDSSNVVVGYRQKYGDLQ